MWKRLTKEELTAQLSPRELEAYSKCNDGSGNDPVETILENTALLVRAYVRAAGSVKFSTDKLAVPGSCVAAALDYALFDVCKRVKVPINDDRRNARNEAVAFFNLVRERKVPVESIDEDDTGDSDRVATTPASLPDDPPYLLD